jgi:hypothetical protein
VVIEASVLVVVVLLLWRRGVVVIEASVLVVVLLLLWRREGVVGGNRSGSVSGGVVVVVAQEGWSWMVI